MPTKANEAAAGNSPLFAFTNQPLRRITSTVKARKPRTERDAAPLMTLVPPPAAPVAPVVDTTDLPRWAMTPPIQAFISYIDKFGSKQKHHVVPHLDLAAQDIELARTIKEIRRDGGRNLVMEVIAVRDGVCVSRWEVA